MDKQIYSSLLKNIWNTKEKDLLRGVKKFSTLLKVIFQV